MMPLPPASLPMYDWPALRSHTDAWWAGLVRHLGDCGIAAPARLNRGDEAFSDWHNPQLLLSQTCGLPYRRHLRDQVQLVATPVYRAPGCGDGSYSSGIIVAAANAALSLEDLAGARAVCNSKGSLSGMLALALMLPENADRPFFSGITWSSGHQRSIKMVAQGDGDVAAIDAVSLEICRRTMPELGEKIAVIDWSPSFPALPYITSAARSSKEVALLRSALLAAINDPGLETVRSSLLIEGFKFFTDADYSVITRQYNDLAETGRLAEFA